RFSRDWSSDVCSSDLRSPLAALDSVSRRPAALHEDFRDVFRQDAQLPSGGVLRGARRKQAGGLLDPRKATTGVEDDHLRGFPAEKPKRLQVAPQQGPGVLRI